MTIVTLITGESVENDSEAWRAESEARMVANLPTTHQRHEYIAIIERKRGPAAAKAMRDLATEIRVKARGIA